METLDKRSYPPDFMPPPGEDTSEQNENQAYIEYTAYMDAKELELQEVALDIASLQRVLRDMEIRRRKLRQELKMDV